jgi:hypothetical protein
MRFRLREVAAACVLALLPTSRDPGRD